VKKNPFIFFISIQLLNIYSIGAQSVLLNADSSFRYNAATGEPPSDWYMPGFNDLSWMVGAGVIGFGYSAADLDVPIGTGTKSLYLRYKFIVNNKENIKKANYFADFDDGYIAYLNGKEILRKNVSFNPEYPAYNDIAERSHESETFHGTTYPILGYYLDSLLLDSCLVEGENTIAVHVLNDSLNGSDLLYVMNLYDMTQGDYNYYESIYKYKGLYHIDSANFPLVIINTDEFGIPYKNIHTKAFMGIVDNGPGKYNKPTDPFNVYNGDISIELRGQSSADFPKQSYRLSTIDASENDSNVSLLGMPSENDWILFGPFHDKSQFRNKMIYDLGHKLGAYQPRSRFCELILNGDLVGLYCLTENIKRDKNRVNISKLKETDLSGHDVTGGYIMKWDKNQYNSQEFQIVYPKEDKIKPEQTAYINSFMQEYNTVLSDDKFMYPIEGFRKYISDSSLVDYVIMNELTKNCDAYFFSTYLYKDREDKDNRLKFGPLWDYDLAFGNTQFQQGNLTYGWQFGLSTNGVLRITRLFQDVNLVHLFQDRWHQLRQGFLYTDSIFAFIDTLVNTIQKPVERNYLVWPVIDEELFYPNYVSRSYNEEIYNIKNWLGSRLQWIDDNIDDIYYPVFINPVKVDPASIVFDVYPNPFSKEIFLSISSENAEKIRVELLNLLGQVRFVENVSVMPGSQEIKLDNAELEDLPAGIFILRLLKNNRLIDLRRVVKK
jgi:hypothetical protein